MPATHDDLFPALRHMPDAVIVVDLDNRIRYANPAVSRLLGWDADELRGALLTATVIPRRLRAAHETGFARFVAGEPMRHAGVPMRVAALHHDGHEIEIDLVLGSVPGTEGQRWAIATLRDVGDRLALERELLIGRYLRASVAVAAALQKATDTSAAFEALLPPLCEHLDWDLAAIWQPTGDESRLGCVATWHDTRFARASAEMTQGVTMRPGEGLPGRVWAIQQPALLETKQDQARLPRARVARRHGLATGLAFPLLGASRPLGVVEFWSEHSRQLDDDLRDVLLSIGRQLGVFIERVDAVAELRRALEVLQSSLLPSRLPNIPHLRLGVHYQPGGKVGVGGDFFDVFALADGRWAIVIADVCGKGAEAATVTSMARYTIRTAAFEHGDPVRVLEILNQAMLGNASDRPFVTACLVILDTRAGDTVATVTPAGHPLPLLRDNDGQVRPVGEVGDLIGVLEAPVFRPTSVRLEPGELLLLYTDGFTEARDAQNAQLGETGLAALLSTIDAREPADVVEALAAALAKHTANELTRDDAAAVAIGAAS
jgi:PAS domain S-box-containing protein